MKTIIKLKDTDVVSIDGNILTIESNKPAVTVNVEIDGKEIVDKVIEQLKKENTTTKNSDVDNFVNGSIKATPSQD